MSYIEILILRRLRSAPAHGYELRKRVEQTAGVVLHNNSLYPALKRFEEAGAVVKTAQAQQGRPPRLVYTLTDTGRELLHDMLADLPPEHAADDAEFVTRLGQFSLISPAERAEVLTARTEAIRERLAHLEHMRELSVKSDERWGALVTAEMIRRDREELTWLAGLMELAIKPDPVPPHELTLAPVPTSYPEPTSRLEPTPDPEPASGPESAPAQGATPDQGAES